MSRNRQADTPRAGGGGAIRRLMQEGAVRHLTALAGAYLLLAATLYQGGLFGLSHNGLLALATLLFAMLLWSTQVLPHGVASLVVVSVLVITGLGGNFQGAVRGFTSETFFFLIGATLLSRAAERAGLVSRVALFLFRRFPGGVRARVWSVAASLLILAVFLPSAIARVQAIIPIVERLNQMQRLPGSSNFMKAASLILAWLSSLATVAALTGGNMTIVTAEIIREYVGPIDWVTWFKAMFPVVAVAMAVGTMVVVRLYPPEADHLPARSDAPRGDAAAANDAANDTAATAEADLTASAPMSPLERTTALILALVVLAWIIGSFFGLSLAVTALLGAAVLSLPRLGLLSEEDFRRVPWGSLFLIASALSLGRAVAESDLAPWLADRLVSLEGGAALPAGSLQYLVLITLALLLARLVFISPGVCLSVMLPILLQIPVAGYPNGHASLRLIFLLVIVVNSLLFLPAHAPVSLYVYSLGHVDAGALARTGAIMFPLVLALGSVSYFYFWPLLGL